MRCVCGSQLKVETCDSFDFSHFLDLSGVYVEGFPLYRCGRCSLVAMDIELVGAILQALTLRIITFERRLTPREARFLRGILRLTQSKLAQRMGVNRVTVAEWERGSRPLSDTHDYILRSLAEKELPIPIRIHAEERLKRVPGNVEEGGGEPADYRIGRHESFYTPVFADMEIPRSDGEEPKIVSVRSWRKKRPRSSGRAALPSFHTIQQDANRH